jgi:hypothetical protein
MKAPEIADRFQRSLYKFGDLRIRVLKLRALCERSGVHVEEVISLLPDELQRRIADA